MNRSLLVIICIVLSASAVSAQCEGSTLFNPSFSVSSIDLPNALRATMSGSGARLDLNPATGVEITRVRFHATSDLEVRGITLNWVERSDGQFDLTIAIRIDELEVSLEDLSDATISFEAEVEYTHNGEEKSIRLCLGDLDVNVRGSIERVERGAREVAAAFEDIDSIFDIIELVLAVARVGAEFECAERTAHYEFLEGIFSENCMPWESKIRTIIVDDVDPSAACPTDAFCHANMTGTGGGSNCPALYERLLETEANMSRVCSRINCKPVLTLEGHTDSYRDPLGITRCAGADLSDEECRLEFERVQGAFCPDVNVTELQNAPAADPDTDRSLLSLPDACGAGDTIETLKDGAADITSAMQCMCLPAIQGYVGQVKRMYEFAEHCFDDNSSRECSDAAYQFVCEMTLGTALRCGGLGFNEFSGSRTFYDRDGNRIDFSDPDEAAAAIEGGGIYVLNTDGSVDIDTNQLAHQLCEAALGDEDVDYAALLDFDATVTSSGSRLCPSSEELKNPCLCDLRSSGSAGLCGTDVTGNYCEYDTDTMEAFCRSAPTTGTPSDTATENAALERITRLPPGVHSSEKGIISCEGSDQGVGVRIDLGYAQIRYAEVRNGYVVLHEIPGMVGAVVERSYACSDDRLIITHRDTGITP